MMIEIADAALSENSDKSWGLCVCLTSGEVLVSIGKTAESVHGGWRLGRDCEPPAPKITSAALRFLGLASVDTLDSARRWFFEYGAKKRLAQKPKVVYGFSDIVRDIRRVVLDVAIGDSVTWMLRIDFSHGATTLRCWGCCKTGSAEKTQEWELTNCLTQHSAALSAMIQDLGLVENLTLAQASAWAQTRNAKIVIEETGIPVLSPSMWAIRNGGVSPAETLHRIKEGF